jgi:CRISPR type I-E-associated protein CasB/Cse2
MTTTHQQDSQLHPGDHRNAAKIAARLTWRDVTTGDVAGLRRLNAQRPTEAMFWKVCNQLEIAQAPQNLIQAWAAIFRMLAAGTKVGDTQTTGPHDGNIPLGQALAQQGYSERRMKTLLDADTGALHPIVERMTRFLNSKGQKFNWNDAARLALTEHRTPEQRNFDRTRIARDYYRELHEQERR